MRSTRSVSIVSANEINSGIPLCCRKRSDSPFLRRARSWLLMTTALLALPATAADFYWNNAAGDGLWSNPGNWRANAVPGSNDVVFLQNHAPDEPQQIILDQNAWLTRINLSATGMRNFTITPLVDQFIQLSGDHTIYGRDNCSVELTINADLYADMTYFRVVSLAPITINGAIRPAGDESRNITLIAHNDVPLVLANSNNLYNVQLNNNGRVVARHPFALGRNTVVTYDCTSHGSLVLETNVVMEGLTGTDQPLEITIAASGARDVSLDFGGATSGNLIRIGPRGPGASGRLLLRSIGSEKTQYAEMELADYSSLIFAHESGTTYWGNSNSGQYRGSIRGAGSVVINTGGSVLLAATNSYTGGTFVERGSLSLYRKNGLPTAGAVWLREGATIEGYAIANKHEFASLTGAGKLTLANYRVTRSLDIGDDGAPGTLQFIYFAKLELGPDAVTTFKLGAPAGINDRVELLHGSSQLTLDGTLRIVNLGGLESGSYKLFDMAGKDRIFGAFSALEMPPASSGVLEIDSSGDLVLHVTRHYGTIFSIR